MADEKLEIDITAKDDASKVIDPLTKKVDKLEQSDPEVTVDADTGDAEGDVESFAKKLSKLGDSDQVVVLALRAGAAQSELSQLATDIATLDAADPDIDVKLERYAEVAGQLDDLETKMKDIADTSLDPDVGGKAEARLHGINEEAGKAQDAVHSMAGNAVGDFAATTTGIGPLGEAIGQLTEGIAKAEVDFKQLAVAGLSMGAVAAAMWEVQQAMAKIEARKAFDKAQIDGFTAALKQGKTAAQALHDTLEATGKIEAPAIASWANPFADATSDVTQHVANLGLTLDQFNALVEDYAKNAGEAGSLTRTWGKAQREAGADAADMVPVMNAIATAAGNLNKAEEAQAANATVFGDTAKQVDLFNKATEEMRNKLVGADKAADGLAKSIGKAVGNTKDLTSEYDKLSGQISNDQSMIDLAEHIDAVTTAGNDAFTAQHEADEARRKGAKDAADQQHEAEQAMRDYQTAVNQTKEDIIAVAQAAHVNPVELKATLDKIDQGDLAGAKADAEAWSRRNPVEITVKLSDIGAAIKKLSQQASSAVGSTPTSVTNITNFLAAPVAARELARAQGRRARINGR